MGDFGFLVHNAVLWVCVLSPSRPISFSTHKSGGGALTHRRATLGMTENDQSKLTTVHATGLPSCKANVDPHSVSEVNQSELLSLAGELAW